MHFDSLLIKTNCWSYLSALAALVARSQVIVQEWMLGRLRFVAEPAKII